MTRNRDVSAGCEPEDGVQTLQQVKKQLAYAIAAKEKAENEQWELARRLEAMEEKLMLEDDRPRNPTGSILEEPVNAFTMKAAYEKEQAALLAGKMNVGNAHESHGEGAAQREIKIGKGRPDLISPFALKRIGKWLELGAIRYGGRNWEKGMPFDTYMQGVDRHLLEYKCGDRSEDHLAAICFGIMAIMHHEELGEDAKWDDLPKYAPAVVNVPTTRELVDTLKDRVGVMAMEVEAYTECYIGGALVEGPARILVITD